MVNICEGMGRVGLVVRAWRKGAGGRCLGGAGDSPPQTGDGGTTRRRSERG